METKKQNVILIVLVIIIIFLFGLYLNEKIKNTKLNQKLTQVSQQPTEQPIVAPLPPGTKINVKLKSGIFEPQSFKVRAGERVYLIVNNQDDDWYNLIWKSGIQNEPPAAGVIGSGQEIYYIFEAPQKQGSYYFYSSRPEHKVDFNSKTGPLFELIVE